MQNFEYNDEESYQDTIKSKLEQLQELPLKFKHKSLCIRSKAYYKKNKSQTCFQMGELFHSIESSDESIKNDSSEILMSEFDISEENKNSNILCYYKNSFFNEKIKAFNEIKSKKYWESKQVSIKLQRDDSSVQLKKSLTIKRQQSPISETSQNLSFLRRMRDITEHSCEQSLLLANSPLNFHTHSQHQTTNNNNQISNNNSSSNMITMNNNNRSLYQQSQNNSLYTIDVPCNESLLQQQNISKIIINEKDIQFQLIESIFSKNLQTLTILLIHLQKEYRSDLLNNLDLNGNTPLMLAIKIQIQQNQFDTIRLLLSNGADPSVKDINGWSPIEETVAQMDIITTSLLFDYLVTKKIFEIQAERNQIDQELLKIDDFYLEMKWEFKSNLIPFISKFTPNDIFKIYKRSTSLRLDSTFAGAKSYKTKRRDMSVLYNPLCGQVQRKENSSNCKFVVMLNKTKKIYYHPIQEIDPEEKKQILLDLLNCDSVNGEMKVVGCSLNKSKNFFGNYVKQSISHWNCEKYEFKVQTQQQFVKKNQHHLFVTKDQYINQAYDQNPITDRFNIDNAAQQMLQDSILVNTPTIMKQSDTQFQASFPSRKTLKETVDAEKNQSKQSQKSCLLYISKEFPINFSQFLPIITMLSKGNEFLHSLQAILDNKNVKELLDNKGFPVRIEIPINFSVDAVITFQAYRKLDLEDLQTQQLFQIPEGFSYLSRRDATKVMKREKKRLFLANLFL